MHTMRFPNENAAYRNARNDLLQAEVELRKQLETVAALRRKLPPGGSIPEDYVFEEGSPRIDDVEMARRVRLSELFRNGQQSLILYSFMFGPAMPSPCPMCTSILDGLNGTAPHVMDRVSFAVVAKSPIKRIREFARGRGWDNLRLISSASNNYNRDYHAETDTGSQLPALNVFVKRDGQISHFYNTELLYLRPEAGQEGRHVDLIWPLWNLFDFVPEGRGSKWYPKLQYENLVSR